MITFSYYRDGPKKLFIGENRFNDCIANYHSIYNKPVIISETAGMNEDCSGYSTYFVDLMRLGFTGISGFQMWPGFDHNAVGGTFDQQNLWNTVITSQNHMESDQVISVLSNNNGQWMQKSIVDGGNNKNREMHYYLSSDQSNVVGVIYNRTYNYYTKFSDISCHDQDNNVNGYYELLNIGFNFWGFKLKVSNLMSNHNYKTNYFGFKNGTFLDDDCQDTNGDGELILKHPKMWVIGSNISNSNPETPVLWFNTEEYNCQGKSNSNGEDDIRESLQIYPNPFKNEIMIDFLQKSDLKVIDMHGKLQFEGTFEPGQKVIDLSYLDSGLYFIQIQNQMFKIIKL